MENTEEFNNKIKFNTVKTLNFNIKISYIKIAGAKDRLKDDPNFKFVVMLKKLGKNNSKEKQFTKKRTLKESIIYFQNEIFNFTKVELTKDILEVSIILLSSEKNIIEFKAKKLSMNDLYKELHFLKDKKEKQDIWTLNNQTLLQVSFKFDEEIISTPIVDSLRNKSIVNTHTLRNEPKENNNDKFNAFEYKRSNSQFDSNHHTNTNMVTKKTENAELVRKELSALTNSSINNSNSNKISISSNSNINNNDTSKMINNSSKSKSKNNTTSIIKNINIKKNDDEEDRNISPKMISMKNIVSYVQDDMSNNANYSKKIISNSAFSRLNKEIDSSLGNNNANNVNNQITIKIENYDDSSVTSNSTSNKNSNSTLHINSSKNSKNNVNLTHSKSVNLNINVNNKNSSSSANEDSSSIRNKKDLNIKQSASNLDTSIKNKLSVLNNTSINPNDLSSVSNSNSTVNNLGINKRNNSSIEDIDSPDIKTIKRRMNRKGSYTNILTDKVKADEFLIIKRQNSISMNPNNHSHTANNTPNMSHISNTVKETDMIKMSNITNLLNPDKNDKKKPPIARKNTANFKSSNIINNNNNCNVSTNNINNNISNSNNIYNNYRNSNSINLNNFNLYSKQESINNNFNNISIQNIQSNNNNNNNNIESGSILGNHRPILKNQFSNEKTAYTLKLFSSSPQKTKDNPKKLTISSNYIENSNNSNNNNNAINLQKQNSKNNSSNSNKHNITVNNNYNSNYNRTNFSNVEFIELNYEDYFDYEIGDNFIEAIFLAGIPKTNSKLVTDSDKLLAPCKHNDCSLLNAYKPDILCKFPGKGRSSLELTNLSASLCFTHGIKVCFYAEDCKLSLQEDFVNVMTNECGDRFYQYNYHFYVKSDFINFQREFNINPTRNPYLLQNVKILEKHLETISKLNAKDFVYIPYCLVCVSKYPYSKQILSCLESLVSLIFNDNLNYNCSFSNNIREAQESEPISSNKNTNTNPVNNDTNNIKNSINFDLNNINNVTNFNNNINTNLSNRNKTISNSIKNACISKDADTTLTTLEKFETTRQNLRKISQSQMILELIKHLTYEVPIPSEKELLGKKLKVYVPYIEKPIEIYLQDNELPLFSYDLIRILDYISVETLVIIFHLMLHERRILFVGKTAKELSLVLEIVRNLIYPMKWDNTYIPVLSEDLLKFLQSFIPYIMGIEYSLLDLAKEHIENQEDIFFVYIDKNIIKTVLNRETKKVNKKNLKLFIYDFDTEEYERLENSLKELNELKEIAIREKKKLNNKVLNKQIIKIFCSYIVELIGNYQKYLTYIDRNACFNLELFINSKSNHKYRNFLSEIVQSQNFNSFIHFNPLKYTYFNKLIQKNSGKRTTNVATKTSNTGILSMFTKKKYLDIQLKDIIVNSYSGENSNLENISILKPEGNLTSNRKNYDNHSVNNSAKKAHNTSNISSVEVTGTTKVPYSPTMMSKNSAKQVLPLTPKTKSVNTSMISNRSETLTPEMSQELSEYNIPPFFIRDSYFLDAERLDDYLDEYLKKPEILIKENRVFKYEKLIEFIDLISNFKEDQEKFKRLVISNDNKDITFMRKASSKLSMNKNDDGNEKRKTDLFKTASNNDLNKEKENEKLHYKITDFLKKILTSQIISDSEIKGSNTFFQTKFGRKCIAEVIYQEKFKNHKYHQLSENGFNSLRYIVSNCLILSEFTEEQLEDIIKTTKACFHYYKELDKSKEPYYIYQEITRINVKIWDNEDLWFKCFELEIKDFNDEDLIIMNNNADNYYFSKILPVFTIMKDLNLDVNFVKQTIAKMAESYLKDKSLKDELDKMIQKQYEIKNRSKRREISSSNKENKNTDRTIKI